MANTYLYFSNALDAATLTATCASGFPKENLQDRDKKSPAMPASAGTYIVDVDAGENVIAGAIMIPGNNAYSQAITGLNVQHDDNGGYTSPTDVVGSVGSPHAPTANDEPTWFELFSGVEPNKTDRYWRVRFAGATTALEIGDIYLAERITVRDLSDVARHPGGAWSVSDEPQGQTTDERGVIHAVSWGVGRDVISVQFRAIPKALVDEIMEAHKSIVRGSWLPWWYSNEYGVLKHVRFDGRPQANHLGKLWDLTMQLKEEPA